MKISSKHNWEKFWEQKSNLHEVYPNSDRIRVNLAKHLNLNGKRILEIGAGTGRDSFYMIKDGASLFLLDYSKNSLGLIRKSAPPQAPVLPVGGNTFALPFPDGTFDAVFHQGLLEHFRKDEADNLLRENIRVLKSGGHLIVDVPQRWHIYTIIKHILIALNAWFAGWEREFSAQELKKLLIKHGVRPVGTYGEWMYPSLFYRMLREVLLKTGLKLPLFPTFFPAGSRFRRRLSRSLDGSWLKINTALSIGVVAVK